MSYHPYHNHPEPNASGVTFFGQLNGKDQVFESDSSFIYSSGDSDPNGAGRLFVGNLQLVDDARIGVTSHPNLIELAGEGTVTFNSGVVVQGDLTVNGTQFISNTETVVIADNILLLNSGVTGTPTESAGLEVQRGAECNVHLIWEEDKEKWMFTNGEKIDPALGCGNLDQYNKFDNLRYHRIGVANNGLFYDATDGEYFSVGEGDGISVNTNDISVKAGLGLEIENVNQNVQVKAHHGITVDSNGVSVTPGTGILVNADGVHVNICDSLLVDSSDCIGINAGSGLLTDTNGLHVGEGNGLTVNADDVTVKAHHGITVDAFGVSVTDGSGILVQSDGVHVGQGNGLTVSADEVAVSPGSGIDVTDGNVNVDIAGQTNTTTTEDADKILIERSGSLYHIEYSDFTEGLGTIKSVETLQASQIASYTYKDVSLVNAGNGILSFELPPAIAESGRTLIFKKSDASSHKVNVEGSGTQTIDGSDTKSLYYRWETLNVISDGTNWYIV
tara:strand:- start:1498 stop:3006 length:1509 start_codon:yes stop_codon:yes gene_type:complete